MIFRLIWMPVFSMMIEDETRIFWDIFSNAATIAIIKEIMASVYGWTLPFLGIDGMA